MYIPPSLLQATNQTELPPSFKLNDQKNDIHFTSKFKYLGSIITPCLAEDAKIEAQIKKAKSQMGILKHYFNCKDIAQHVKYWIYITGPLNILLWDSESWNISNHNRNNLHAFHCNQKNIRNLDG